MFKHRFVLLIEMFCCQIVCFAELYILCPIGEGLFQPRLFEYFLF